MTVVCQLNECLSCPSFVSLLLHTTRKKSWIFVANSARRGFPEVNANHKDAGFLPYEEQIADF